MTFTFSLRVFSLLTIYDPGRIDEVIFSNFSGIHTTYSEKNGAFNLC